MPGPFPGMDPYLEDPIWWPGVHSELIASARGALNRALPSGYAANTDERLYVVESDRNIYPDLALSRRRHPSGDRRGGSALATEPWIVSAPPHEVREGFIEIVSVAAGRKVVTVLEFLSPANKAAGSEGARLYKQKQRELIGSEINLVEIDLIRTGEHTVAAPLSVLQERGDWNYLACLHRPVRRWEFKVWPATLFKPLPVILVPFGRGDEHVELDLQAVLERTYEEGGYEELLDYTAPPPGPLTTEERDWVDSVLASIGSSNGKNE